MTPPARASRGTGRTGARTARQAARAPATGDAPRLLAGGNPQVAKGDGDAVVQQYIAAMPGWKREVGRRLDRLVSQAVPDVRKAGDVLGFEATTTLGSMLDEVIPWITGEVEAGRL